MLKGFISACLHYPEVAKRNGVRGNKTENMDRFSTLCLPGLHCHEQTGIYFFINHKYNYHEKIHFKNELLIGSCVRLPLMEQLPE